MLFAELNPKQQEAVDIIDGRIKVVAGAGSGKTRVLAARYANLVDNIGIDPSGILCMTFTNKAAQEMKFRIAKYLRNGFAGVNDLICTIHGFCVKVLRRDIYRYGWPESFNIWDEYDFKDFTQQIMEELQLDRSKTSHRELWTQIEAYKEKFRDSYVYELKETNEVMSSDPIANIWFRLQVKNFCLDFHDLVYFTLRLFQDFPEVLGYWQEKLEFVQVDEVQDCNNNDWKIIDLITQKSGNLLIVGDPDQAIYEWRGSKPDVFKNFVADQTIILDDNYRSTPEILNCANSIIKHNTNRIHKELQPNKIMGDKPIYFHAKNEEVEANYVATKIKELLENENYSDFCILYRAHYVSRAFEQAFMNNNIPYSVNGGVKFFDRTEIKNAFSYLELIDSDNNEAFRKIINVPSRKFGRSSLEKLENLAGSKSLYETLKNNINKPPFNKPKIVRFIEIIEYFRKNKNEYNISDLLYQIVRETGLYEYYRTHGDVERLENINELFQSIKIYEKNNSEEEDLSLTKYLNDMSIYRVDDYHQEENKVKLMTIHQAKGLEFPYVFIVGLNEGIIPSLKTIRDRGQEGEEEERRLMYVAITRAMEKLFLTDSDGFLYSQGGMEKLPSRFLFEIEPELIQNEGEVIEKDIIEKIKNLQNNSSGCNGCSNCNCFNEKFNIGTLVTHKVFGQGKIIEIDNELKSCKVEFENSKIRKIKTNFLIAA